MESVNTTAKKFVVNWIDVFNTATTPELAIKSFHAVIGKFKNKSKTNQN